MSGGVVVGDSDSRCARASSSRASAATATQRLDVGGCALAHPRMCTLTRRRLLDAPLRLCALPRLR
jgi:hypothetical protein